MRFGFASNKWNTVCLWFGIKPKEQNPTLHPRSNTVPFSPRNEVARSKNSGSNSLLINTFLGSGSLRSITVLAVELYWIGSTLSCKPKRHMKSRTLCLCRNLGNQGRSCIKVEIRIVGDFRFGIKKGKVFFYLLELVITIVQQEFEYILSLVA